MELLMFTQALCAAEVYAESKRRDKNFYDVLIEKYPQFLGVCEKCKSTMFCSKQSDRVFCPCCVSTMTIREELNKEVDSSGRDEEECEEVQEKEHNKRICCGRTYLFEPEYLRVYDAFGSTNANNQSKSDKDVAEELNMSADKDKVHKVRLHLEEEGYLEMVGFYDKEWRFRHTTKGPPPVTYHKLVHDAFATNDDTRVLDGKSVDQVAKELDIPVGLVKATCEDLMTEGFLYGTIDEDHFRSTGVYDDLL